VVKSAISDAFYKVIDDKLDSTSSIDDPFDIIQDELEGENETFKYPIHVSLITDFIINSVCFNKLNFELV
jgi:hypothetical protein